jgi:hypothetical protein
VPRLKVLNFSRPTAAKNGPMKPIVFSCEGTLPRAPEEIASQILDLANWPAYTGFWPLPGIKRAEFEVRTPEIVGTRFRVTDTDGSSHVEEIVEWQPTHRLQLRMHDFSAPLSRFATRFEETWQFERTNEGTLPLGDFALAQASHRSAPPPIGRSRSVVAVNHSNAGQARRK